ncbi:MAG: hypothetical protein ACXABD_22685 [Candidatus Thorarchaeota archaeon]|jgi:hypothetical protein
MLDKHIKRDGSTVLVAQLSDDHLNNFINLVLKQVMVAQGAKQEGVTEYHRRLYNLPTIADLTREALTRLYPYLSEAYLRGLEGPRKLLIKVLGREDAVPNYSGVPQLPGRLPVNLGDLDDTNGQDEFPIDLEE